MVPAAPGGASDGLGLQQIGSRSSIAEGGNIVAERRKLPWHIEMLHEREVILAQFRDRRSATGDDH